MSIKLSRWHFQPDYPLGVRAQVRTRGETVVAVAWELPQGEGAFQLEADPQTDVCYGSMNESNVGSAMAKADEELRKLGYELDSNEAVVKGGQKIADALLTSERMELLFFVFRRMFMSGLTKIAGPWEREGDDAIRRDPTGTVVGRVIGGNEDEDGNLLYVAHVPNQFRKEGLKLVDATTAVDDTLWGGGYVMLGQTGEGLVDD